MNIHPLFVHFPIALLVMYSLLEMGGYFFSLLRRQTWLFAVKAFLLFAGVLAALATIVTGGLAEDLIKDSSPQEYIVMVHDPFSKATTLLYLILAVAYLVRIFDRRGWGDRIVGTNSFMAGLWNFKKRFWHFLLDTWLLPVIALLALIGITITGALGAAIVYGPNADPFVSLVYHLFWTQ